VRSSLLTRRCISTIVSECSEESVCFIHAFTPVHMFSACVHVGHPSRQTSVACSCSQERRSFRNIVNICAHTGRCVKTFLPEGGSSVRACMRTCVRFYFLLDFEL